MTVTNDQRNRQTVARVDDFLPSSKQKFPLDVGRKHFSVPVLLNLSNYKHHNYYAGFVH